MEGGPRRSGRVRKQMNTLATMQAEVAELAAPARKKRKVNIVTEVGDYDTEPNELIIATTAVARTFGIVELLEQILLHLTEPAGDWKPAKKLFRLQRVNSTFRSTILGSKPLRQLMLLDHDTSIDTGAVGNLSPLWWVFDNLLGLRKAWQIYKTQGNVKTFSLAGYGPWRDLTSKARAKMAASTYNNKNASWRKIKLAPSKYSLTTCLLSWPMNTPYGTELISQTIVLDLGCTLGNFHDLAEELLSPPLRDLQTLSHLHCRHKDEVDLSKAITLGSGEPLPTVKALQSYKETLKAAEKKLKGHGGGDKVEKWKRGFSYVGEWDRDCGLLKRCALCKK